MVPLLIDLYNHVNGFEPVYLGTMVTALRDGLMRRFEGAYTRLKMGVTLDLEKAPFSHKVYPVATVLYPNMVLYWVELDLNADAEEKVELREQLRGMQYIISVN